MARNKKTTETQHAWAQNGYLPDSKYRPTPHKTMEASQYRRAGKVRGDQILKPYECHYIPRGTSAHNARILPSIRVHATDEIQARVIAEKVLHRHVTHAIEQVCR